MKSTASGRATEVAHDEENTRDKEIDVDGDGDGCMSNVGDDGCMSDEVGGRDDDDDDDTLSVFRQHCNLKISTN